MSGLEAIGAAAAIIQVAETGLRLSKSIYEYADSYQSADARLNQFAQDVDRTSNIVRDVGDLFSDATAQNHIAAGGLKTTRDCVKDCEEAFKEIQTFVEHARKSRWKFPYREQKLRLLDARLEKLKSNLSLVLMILSRSKDLKQAVSRKEKPNHE
jgi:hypothetical protein